MNKLLLLIVPYVLIFTSCTNKKTITGKWQMVDQNDVIVNFITDSTGLIERADSDELKKTENFKYHIQDDTLFEHTPTHLFQPRKWIIIKLDKDSLIIYREGTTVRYYSLP